MPGKAKSPKATDADRRAKRASTAVGSDAPSVLVQCPNTRCPKSSEAPVAVPSGVVIGESVFTPYSPACLYCGCSMSVLGPA